MLVGPQLRGHRPPVRGDGRDGHDLPHLEVPDQLAHLYDLAHALVYQDAVRS